MAGGEIQQGDVLTYTVWGISTVQPAEWETLASCLADKVADYGTLVRWGGSSAAASVTVRSSMERAHVNDLKGNLDSFVASCLGAGPFSGLQSTIVKDSGSTPTTTPGAGGQPPPPGPKPPDIFAQWAAQLGVTRDQLIWGGAGALALILMMKK